MANVPGGFSVTKPSTEEIQKYCIQAKCQVEGKINQKYTEFKAVQYRQQVVAGMNYLIKILVGHDNYIHVKLFHNLPCNGGALVVNGVQEHHKKNDPLEPF